MMETQDFFTIMGGRVKILRDIYNPTSDAVWLAAFIDGAPKTVLDVGTGTGAVALCLMARMPDISVTALDISPEMLTAAMKNFNLNKRNAEFINADIMEWRPPITYDLVITNPPYFKGTPAHHNAHHNTDLVKWTRRCIARVKPGGTFATIVDATEAARVIGEMSRHCGDFRILPFFSTKKFAERVLISGRAGRSPQCRMFTGLPMNHDGILRNGMPVNEIINTQLTQKSL